MPFFKHRNYNRLLLHIEHMLEIAAVLSVLQSTFWKSQASSLLFIFYPLWKKARFFTSWFRGGTH